MKVTDPVCGMTIDSEKASAKAEHQGTTYYFCSQSCKASFEKSPEQYLKKGKDDQGHGH